jgi:pimeloyl-ACP methyl ester carboxylesterase
MARAVHRRPVTWVAAFAVFVATLWLGTGRAAGAAGAAADCQSVSPQVTSGTTPILFVHGINSGPWAWTPYPGGPTGNVEGTSEPPLQYIQNKLGNAKVTGYTFDWSKDAAHVVKWVTGPPSPNLGMRLAEAVGCVARAAGHKVIIVAWSMGGLLAQDAGSIDPADVAAVFTMGTPYHGSWLASAFAGQAPDDLGPLSNAVIAICSFTNLPIVCPLVSERNDTGVEAMRLNGGPKGGWTKLPPWPTTTTSTTTAAFPVYSLAGSITGAWQPLWPLTIGEVPLTGSGDWVVSTNSQRGTFPGMTLSCAVTLNGNPLGDPLATDVSITELLETGPCIHTSEPDSKALLDYIVSQAGPMLPTMPTTTTTPTPTSQVPEFYVHNGYELGSIYQYPNFPTSIGLDNHDSISALRWAQPSQTGITATGTLNVDNCTPDCASGTYDSYPVELVVSAPQHCTVNVYQQYSDKFNSEQAYVYNTIYVKALSGSPPSYLVGNTQALPPACEGSPGNGSSSGISAPCTSTALSSVLTPVAKSLPTNWVVDHYACESGYAFAGIDPGRGGFGLPVVALFKQQGETWELIWGPTEDNCLVPPYPPGCQGRTPPVPEPLVQSLVSQAGWGPPS